MSQTDSFIEEVSEAVRRERLFRYFKRYGWIAILAVILLVAAAAYNEYSRAQERIVAEARGDAIMAAREIEDGPERAEAFGAIKEAGDTSPVVAMLYAGAVLEEDDREGAAAILEAVFEDEEQPRVYRDMARLKHVMLVSDSLSLDERIAVLEPLAAPGAPFRLLAEEQIAFAELERGDKDAAVDRMRLLRDDSEATRSMRARLRQVIIALGEDPDPEEDSE